MSAMDTFHHYKQIFIRDLGGEALDSNTIERVGAKEFDSKWGGVFGNDDFKPREDSYFIINTGASGGPGYHWCGLYQGRGREAYIMDSYGRPTSRILHNLKRTLENNGLNYVDMERKHQRDGTPYCGHISLAWLCTVRDCGITQALEI